MRISNLLMPTLRETPAEAEILSHKLMLRAGLMRKLAAGIYAYMPLGLRALRKVEDIIREEMDKAGANELLMSALLPAEYFMPSGRWDVFGPEMFRLRDRHDRDFCLGPTHEEIFTSTVKNEIHSYKQLPVTLYQIGTKYRDERRPRFGALRSREFIMKDAYSFDLTEEGLDVSYKKMYEAYCNIFRRLGLDFLIVDADSGAMGGSGSQEFMVKSEVGEDVIASCAACGYTANEEKAECVPDGREFPENTKPFEKKHTPNAHTIEELTAFLGTEPYMFAKTLIYKIDGKYVAAMVRGDREVNETKLQNLLGGSSIELAEPHMVREITKAEVGFAGPIGIDIPVYADKEVMQMHGIVVGANETDMHLINVEPLRDFTPTEVADLRAIEDGDICPRCGKPISTCHGIEVGHIFKLGTKYSKALELTFPNDDGEDAPVIMGCYGIGVNRCMAAAIEQNSDEDGIIWPIPIAPYHVSVIPTNITDETISSLSEDIYNKLLQSGIEALIDDRDERPGVKFKDCDLTGIPLRITVGKKAGEGIVEFKVRGDKNFEELSASDAIDKAVNYIKERIHG